MSEVDHPPHYRHLGVECIDVAEHFNYCMGNALKYIWRADYKGNPIQDLQKSVWYLNREIERRQKSFENSEKIESDNPFYYSPEFVVARDEIMEDALDVLNESMGWIKHDGSDVNPVPGKVIKYKYSTEDWDDPFLGSLRNSEGPWWREIDYYKVVGDAE